LTFNEHYPGEAGLPVTHGFIPHLVADQHVMGQLATVITGRMLFPSISRQCQTLKATRRTDTGGGSYRA